MLNIKGKFNDAVVYTDNVEKGTIAQIIELCNQEFTKGSKIRIMPDCHQGAGCTIGTTMTIKDKVVPNLVGVDIGCGVYVCKLNVDDIDLEKLDELLGTKIPTGFSVRDEELTSFTKHINLKKLKCFNQINEDRALKSLGSLGGGNHFIEVSSDDYGDLYLIIHSGSRHLGKQVCDYYQNQAVEYHKKKINDIVRETVCHFGKTGGGVKELHEELEKITKTALPKKLCYLEGELLDNYLHDMKIIQRYAELNREAMAIEILNGIGLTVEDVEETFHTVHNYIDLQSMILRKGAISAKKGETLLIPINMSDGSLLCKGKGNSDWNYSAPHGAGRVLSRIQAKNQLSMNDFRESMNGIYTTSVNETTLDESPKAYKPMNDIVSNIGDTVDIVSILKPIYNYKAH